MRKHQSIRKVMTKKPKKKPARRFLVGFRGSPRFHKGRKETVTGRREWLPSGHPEHWATESCQLMTRREAEDAVNWQAGSFLYELVPVELGK